MALLALHAPLLRLPYFWDEAGYYVPAARDLLLTGSLIPHSTVSNAHPPLVMAYLALWWKLAGFAPSRDPDRHAAGMRRLLCSACSGWRRQWPTIEVAVATTVLTALYPVFFAQSSLVHLDLAAAGLTFWGLRAYVKGRGWETALWFSLASLTKETAILAPLALFAWELISRRWRSRKGKNLPERQIFGIRLASGSAHSADAPGTPSTTGGPVLFSAIRNFFATTSRPPFSLCESCSPCWFACGRPSAIFIC